jgi:hypothetical protein
MGRKMLGALSVPNSFFRHLFPQKILGYEAELDTVHARCLALMAQGDCDALLFERTAIMLHQARRFEDELKLCSYVQDWASWRESESIFGARYWLSSRYKRIIARRVRAELLLNKSLKEG